VDLARRVAVPGCARLTRRTARLDRPGLTGPVDRPARQVGYRLGMLTPPRALLLDFGGVIVDDLYRADWLGPAVAAVRAVLDGAPVPEIEADLVAGLTGYAAWGNGTARWARPAEVSHEQLWTEFIGADWPPAARAAVAAQATPLTYRLGEIRQDWRLRPGMADLLADIAARGVPVAVVSNTVHGQVHRTFLAAAGVADRFAAQLYSDEAGVRKPNPELVWRAARAVSVDPADAWFVGDTRSRDVRCGRRAGVGTVVLMSSPRTGKEPATAVEPDHEVADPAGLHGLLTRAWAGDPA
jgi:N-acetyl-D-muramate 6-phosphate phosphatase